MFWIAFDKMAKKEFYFEKYDTRVPYRSIPDNKYRNLIFQFAGIITIALGIAYLNWRWRYSLNYNALFFSLLLVIAETLSFISTIMIVINFWAYRDAEKAPPVHFLSEIEDLQGREDRPIRIDIFITTFNEDVELVRLSIIDAKKVVYPYDDVVVKIYVLDDGHRDGTDPKKENMKAIAEEENVGYLIREHNEGYKAGNLKNALKYTNGDLFVILDADTRPFKDFLINTSGYFRKKKVAWVQTPQWFYDTTETEKLSDVIVSRLKLSNKYVRNCLDRSLGRIKVNEDIYGNDPRLFYDVILRKRNFYNAAFCCGAGSIHRREAIMNLALKDFAGEIKKFKLSLIKQHKDNEIINDETNTHVLQKDITPFKFHASEDIYTSIMLHADKDNRWQSIQHPDIECKMLSTQDLHSWIKQHQRYAEGSLDIAIKDNPLFIKGLTLGQRICYFNTIWSYFAPVWILVFLLSPIIFFFTLTLPVTAYSFDFFKYFLPFQVMNTVMITLGCWGICTKRGDQYYISSFWFMLKALIRAIKGKKVKFNVTPKEKQSRSALKHILPHMIIIGLTVLGILYNIVLLAYDRHPTPSGFAANAFWCMFNVVALSIMVRAAYWKPAKPEEVLTPEPSGSKSIEIL
jgi:cellulose synthase (UDP-forming)